MIISIILIILTIKSIINNTNITTASNTATNTNTTNIIILYDGKKLVCPAKKELSTLIKHNKDIKVNCNSNIIECKGDMDCKNNCLKLSNHKINCSNGICRYIQNNSKILCQNGGQIASYFMYGRLYTTCICPKKFIGTLCQISNEMNSSNLKTFDLVY